MNEQVKAREIEDAKKAKIRVSGLTKQFTVHKQKITAFKNINIEIGEGEFWCIVGPSGCGKTTLLRVLAGLEQPSSGTIEIIHKDMNKPLNSMVFQEHAIFPWMSVKENIAYGLKMRKYPKKIIDRMVKEYIEKMDLTKFTNAFPHQLSGGMKQRVSIARAFVNDPEILLMDEPFASLDEQNRLILQQELLSIWESNRKTVVFITHSIDEAIFLSDHIMIMTAHPGKVKSVYNVDLPRPRNMAKIRTIPEFNILFTKMWAELKEEVKQ
ncbi:MAG: ABC transporter ATP-binding protein [Clostridiales bacterium]|nr:ABC transporter ATP-binding protein [Clostridiales bacterium]HBM81596.1 mannosyltransferase [Clostridiaceae bacterium]